MKVDLGTITVMLDEPDVLASEQKPLPKFLRKPELKDLKKGVKKAQKKRSVWRRSRASCC